MPEKRKILVTAALPYANGVPHLGHLVGTIQADIWVRFHKMQGITCIYVCGSDAHGTPIMIQADKMGISPEELIQQIHAQQIKDFTDFHIEFDNYFTTHSKENKELVELIFKKHIEAGNITKREITQLYDPAKEMFLPDRYIKGECPNCGAKDQYGDNCEVCGATYLPTDLKNAYSTLSGTTPVLKKSEHYFFKLQNYESFLKDWTKQGHLQKEVTKKLDEWFADGLREWDISRDAPYFGFKIPGEEFKYFYVWLDAPVGYMASFKNFCESHPEILFDAYWKENKNTELYHFIGKDIIYFHALFWPALLHGATFRTPNKIFVNGFITIDGQKMSKSRGTFIKARTFLDHLPAEYFRYFIASKLSDRIEDLDINFDDFTQKINSDLVGKFINIASRCASFLDKYFENQLADSLPDNELFETFSKSANEIKDFYEKIEYSHAIRTIMHLADRANQYIDEQKPWVLIKDSKNAKSVQAICTLGINLFKQLMVYLKPILPQTAILVEEFLNINALTWDDHQTVLLKQRINKFHPILKRIEKTNIEDLKMSAKEDLSNKINVPTETATQAAEVKKTALSIEDFSKVDLRIAQIVEAEDVPEADKLLKIKVDLGGGETRQIFAGIKAAYKAENLIGKQVVIVANLAPRKMRFGVSEGMILCAGPGGSEIFIIEPDQGAQPGMKVK